MENIENADILKAEIKSILAYKSKDGATFQDVKDEYAYLMGKELCFDSEKQFNNFMRTMSDTYSTGGDGHMLWFSNSTKSKHISTMVQNQKPPREIPIRKHAPLKRTLFFNSTGTCYYNDNYVYKNKRSYKSDCNLSEIKRTRKAASFYNYELVGDDFFLNIANLDCNQRLEHATNQTGFKGRPIKLCGLCVSGQSIRSVTNMFESNVITSNQIILNVGSVDLLHGRTFIEMQTDFMDLYSELESRGVHTVITTLAPLANKLYSKEIQKRWRQFNSFLLDQFPNVIDITCCFVTNTNRVRFECYQGAPKYVTGSSQAHLLWNYVGRQRVLKHLKDSLAELAYSSSIFNSDL
ncbi:maternal effect protein oskar-like [Bradysia coprophila]|uniref:maternal effect protein oskar-like n=1 Tax=Bradysia coprophila TaxID=38358 RepID=UPI00187D95B1|nr:maternal effect protein oskar-like [Bradysia coprophila]